MENPDKTCDIDVETSPVGKDYNSVSELDFGVISPLLANLGFDSMQLYQLSNAGLPNPIEEDISGIINALGDKEFNNRRVENTFNEKENRFNVRTPEQRADVNKSLKEEGLPELNTLVEIVRAHVAAERAAAGEALSNVSEKVKDISYAHLTGEEALTALVNKRADCLENQEKNTPSR